MQEKAKGQYFTLIAGLHIRQMVSSFSVKGQRRTKEVKREREKEKFNPFNKVSNVFPSAVSLKEVSTVSKQDKYRNLHVMGHLSDYMAIRDQYVRHLVSCCVSDNCPHRYSPATTHKCPMRLYLG
jgi:hypothetical protein